MSLLATRNQFSTRMLLILLLLSLTSAATGQASPPQPPARPDFGGIDRGVYSNQFFGLQISIPDGWSVAGEAAKHQLMEKGEQLIKSSDPGQQQAIDDSVNRTTQLLTISKFELGKPNAEPNPSFVCMIEKLPDAAAGIKARDYVAEVGTGLKQSGLPLSPIGEVHVESLDGVEFSVLDVKGKIKEQDVFQKYYAYIIKGYALVFIATSYTEDDQKKNSAIVASVKMRQS